MTRFRATLDGRTDLYGSAEMSVFMPPETMEVSAALSADMVLTLRNMHSWMARDVAGDVFTAAYAALKPGGVFGVVDNRADEGSDTDAQRTAGYVSQNDVVRFAEQAGFILVAASEINANPNDSKDYPGGVWDLPPDSRSGDQNREQYMEIGESDRFTLRFRKPREGG